MTRSKIAITLPREQLTRIHREVRAAQAEAEKRECLRMLLRDLVA